QAAALLFESEERQYARPSLALEWEVRAVQRLGVATEGDRMEVEREPLRFGEEQRGQGRGPPLQEVALWITSGPVGVVARERLLGEDIEAREQAEGLVAAEVVDRA